VGEPGSSRKTSAFRKRTSCNQPRHFRFRPNSEVFALAQGTCLRAPDAYRPMHVQILRAFFELHEYGIALLVRLTPRSSRGPAGRPQARRQRRRLEPIVRRRPDVAQLGSRKAAFARVCEECRSVTDRESEDLSASMRSRMDILLHSTKVTTIRPRFAYPNLVTGW